MTIAQQLERVFKSKYPADINVYSSSIDPIGNNPLCKYCITFTDNSTMTVIMSSRQREGIKRSRWYKDIEKIGGLGYVKWGVNK